MKIFLSYSRADRAEADRLRSALEAAGHDVWSDTEDIRSGDRWREAIVAGIDQADTVVVLLSGHSVESNHVDTEIEIAREKGKRIIPVRLDNASPKGNLYYNLTGVHAVDHVSDPNARSDRLLADLDPTRPRPPPSRSPVRSKSVTSWLTYGAAALALAVIVGVVVSTLVGNGATTIASPTVGRCVHRAIQTGDLEGIALFTNLQDDATLPGGTVSPLSGSTEGVPAEVEVWVFTRPIELDKFYMQSHFGVEPAERTGDEFRSAATISTEAEILVVLATAEASATLSSTLADWEASGEFAGLERRELPDGLEETDCRTSIAPS